MGTKYSQHFTIIISIHSTQLRSATLSYFLFRYISLSLNSSLSSLEMETWFFNTCCQLISPTLFTTTILLITCNAAELWFVELKSLESQILNKNSIFYSSSKDSPTSAVTAPEMSNEAGVETCQGNISESVAEHPEPVSPVDWVEMLLFEHSHVSTPGNYFWIRPVFITVLHHHPGQHQWTIGSPH